MEDFGLVTMLEMTLFSCSPLLFIYFTLKWLNWNQGEKLFSNSWLVYIIWIISTIFVFIFTAVINNGLIFWVGLLFANPINIATTLLLTAKIKKPISISATQTGLTKKISNSQLWKVSFASNFAAIMSVVCVIGAVNGPEFIKEKLNPKAKSEFQIYD